MWTVSSTAALSDLSAGGVRDNYDWLTDGVLQETKIVALLDKIDSGDHLS